MQGPDPLHELAHPEVRQESSSRIDREDGKGAIWVNGSRRGFQRGTIKQTKMPFKPFPYGVLLIFPSKCAEYFP